MTCYCLGETYCNTLQHTATHCNTLRHTATHCDTLRHTATHCDTLQHTATHCNTLQHTATHCNTLQHAATRCNTLQHAATRQYSPAPMNHIEKFKGWPLRDAPSELVQLWYKTFLPDRFLSGEMKKPTMLSNKTSTAWFLAEDQILEDKSPKQDFEYVYWTISKIFKIDFEYLFFSEIYLPVREHKWLIGSGGCLD